MATAVDPTGGADAQQRYFCHQCNQEINIVPPASADPICPFCGGSFVEELEIPQSNPSPHPNRSTFLTNQPGAPNPFLSSPSPFTFLSSAGNIEQRFPGEFAVLLGLHLNPFRPQTSRPPGFHPLLFLRDYIQSFISGGANIQVIFDGSGAGGLGGAGVPLAGNIGDYFFGSRLEHLVHQLFENDPNRYGPPPAAKSVVETLPVIKISNELIAGIDEAQCAVCKEAFVVGEEVVQIPCKHIYHKDCIIPWLDLHNSCPVCRYELPTDDPDYENWARRAPLAPGVVSSMETDHNVGPPSITGGGQRPSERRTVNRRIRISLPWPLRFLGSESSNTGGLSGNSDSGSRDEDLAGRQNSGTEPRLEDLD
ncbi:hypothetical protein HPP92_014376 [Vanilla planifolia]|uniref:RING-type E3 ubiquitin transferase n=1 Tax=Vanilla planifolia TaxID=51239 RepID=A0A835QQU5_VANPL|nr:hypothetical protein HPP92_014376 [Vanilla planifolia]